MTIDINDSVDRWLNNYIVYHSSRLAKYGDVDSANASFSGDFEAQKWFLDEKLSLGQEMKTIKQASSANMINA
jgi:hypothetical protein